MDMNIVSGIISIVVLVMVFPSAFLQWRWYKREGGDERGKLISLKSTYNMCGTLVIGIAALVLIDGSLEISKSLFKLILVSVVGISLFVASVSLLILRNKY
ncbi:hypothetical protein [Paenibacillus hamazuiensis]|uniref:hypothetical protein n=1 Tax=Paenibacillus hamazuiensis TaxID=2936508 RepID=UPI00200DBD21|nr:hypothetical protein [Paenibacillus hamazuiensis]